MLGRRRIPPIVDYGQMAKFHEARVFELDRSLGDLDNDSRVWIARIGAG
jgi:hypothetical protein